MDDYPSDCELTQDELRRLDDVTMEGDLTLGYMLSVVILTVGNCPRTVGYVTRRFTDSIGDYQAAAQVLECTREAIIKTAYWCGIPKAINAMRECVSSVDPGIRVRLTTECKMPVKEEEQQQEKLRKSYSMIFGENGLKVFDEIQDFSPQLYNLSKNIYEEVTMTRCAMGVDIAELIGATALQILGLNEALVVHQKIAQKSGASTEQLDKVTRACGTFLEIADDKRWRFF
ncbi:MAG: hypothetical protein DHS80DRAFT_31269 [Piptocephalis tieghemiana]|nr:MAG: hypothetical protein DHS80DRAFT_31269 [Piptocephalis tieghemiana]